MRATLVAVLVISASVLLFWRLDNVKLYRDEATTANWGRLMSENEDWLPWVVDNGQLLVQASDGHDVNSKLLPAMHSYLQFYTTAFSFKLFGTSVFAARLPFILCGAAALWILHRLGALLFGAGLRPFILPFLGLLSIHFLYAARVCRYYALVYLISTWLLLEFCRYLKDPSLAKERSFYFRIAIAGILLYESNYVSFGGMWGALTLFILLIDDQYLRRGFFMLSTGLALVLGTEFWILHSDFAANWPPVSNASEVQLYQRAFVSLGREFWRTVPFLFLLPATFYAAWHAGSAFSRPLKIGVGLSLLAAASPLFFSYTRGEILERTVLFSTLVVLWGVVPITLFALWKRSGRGVLAQAALLCGLVLLVSPLFTVILGQNEAKQRHYYQIIPATVLLGGLATATQFSNRRRTPLVILFAGLLIWPNLNFPVQGGHVVARQLRNDDSVNGPPIEFLSENVSAHETIAFYRNVKGMAIYFHLPDLKWVGLLDSDVPHNRQFRKWLPADQFDDYPYIDWYVVWSNKGKSPKRLTKEHKLVWEHRFTRRKSWWDRDRPNRSEEYKVYHRIEPTEATATPKIAR